MRANIYEINKNILPIPHMLNTLDNILSKIKRKFISLVPNKGLNYDEIEKCGE